MAVPLHPPGGMELPLGAVRSDDGELQFETAGVTGERGEMPFHPFAVVGMHPRDEVGRRPAKFLRGDAEDAEHLVVPRE